MTKEQDKTFAQSNAGKIWSEIKDKSIDMFALPEQKVSDHCTPVDIEPSKLYLRTRSTAVLPSLEASCGKAFTIELVNKYVVVTRSAIVLTK